MMMRAGPSSFAGPASLWAARPVFDRLALALLAVLVIAAGLTFRDYGLGWDDYTHSQYGDLLLSLYGSGFRDQRALSFVNLYMYGGGFDMLAALAAKILPFDLFETRRLIGGLIGIAGIAATWRLGRRLGGPAAGFLTALLLATLPLFYGHMFMNPKDAPFAVAMAFLLLALVHALEHYPEPPRAVVVCVGLALGVATGTRILALIGALYMLPAMLLLLIDDAHTRGWREAWRRLGRFVLLMLPLLPIAYVTMGLLWPWAVLDPLNPLLAVEYFAHFFEKPWKELYEGALVSVPDMPATYLPKLFSLKLPEIVLLAGAIGLIGTAITAVRRDLSARRRAALLMVAGAALIPVIYAMISRPALYNGVRHFTFILPPIAAIAAVGAVWVLTWLRTRHVAAFATGAALIALGIGSSIADMVRLHPYQYAHFNWLAGGVRGADLNYMLDYWGLAFKQATEDLRAHLKETGEKRPPRGYWIVAVCGPQRVAQVELGAKFQTTADPRRADFALTLGEFYCRNLNAPVIAKVVRDDVTFATVYDIRGRTVGDLLTMPPP